MTRFLKREKWQIDTACTPCVFNKYTICPIPLEYCEEVVFILAPRPPDGTRCRDLDGNLKIVGVDV